ncbi:MAG: hypothetical protein QHC67_08000 [Sphingobium sp.]|uniref:hypothetical protein n=1 Tax=Sphingobium sp. TaxID=1912891 RepID=UPI0029B4D719|nr:hypothetical protein [Sphingobium sp.]MDX3909748.1 hypothetical protein [Sphingobium sp.]
MSTLTSILPYAYLLALVAAGWRLFVVRWSRTLKIASGIVIVTVTPLLVLVPALLHPERPFAGLLLATGIGMLAAGAACLLGGMAGAWLRQRARKA